MDLSNENVIHVKKDGAQFLQFRKLLEFKDIVNHAYTLGTDVNYRVAKPDRTPLPEEVYNKNIGHYIKMCNVIEEDYTKIVMSKQEHTNNVQKVENKINKDKPDFNLNKYNNTDGLITNKKDIILSTTNADCILLMFFDPIKKVIGNVHSGWKGTLQKISINCVRMMKEEYGSELKDILCFICPSIRKCHFEVEKHVKDMFMGEFKDLENIEDIIEEKIPNKKWNIDTVLINETILQKEGLKKENIIDCGICSVCNSDKIHSFRVEKEGYGLETALIKLK